MKTYDDNYLDSDGYLVGVFIRADKFYDSYARKVTDILTLLGDIGGLQDFFIMCGGVLVGFLAQKMFMSSIVKKIYHIRNYGNIEYEASHGNINNSINGSIDSIDNESNRRD